MWRAFKFSWQTERWAGKMSCWWNFNLKLFSACDKCVFGKQWMCLFALDSNLQKHFGKRVLCICGNLYKTCFHIRMFWHRAGEKAFHFRIYHSRCRERARRAQKQQIDKTFVICFSSGSWKDSERLPMHLTLGWPKPSAGSKGEPPESVKPQAGQ